MNLISRLAKILMIGTVIASTLVATLISGPATAQAAALPVVTVSAIPGGNVCSYSSGLMPGSITISTPAFVVIAISALGSTQVFPVGVVSSSLHFAIYGQPFTLPANTLFTNTWTFYNGTTPASGVAITYTFTFNCTTGQLYNGPGPQVPGSFAMKQATCTTPVLNSPAGVQVGSAQVTSGQRWYVSLTPVKGSDGKSYTELFTAGNTDGFIPTACVNLSYNYVYGVN